jgi:hypothetical protein
LNPTFVLFTLPALEFVLVCLPSAPRAFQSRGSIPSSAHSRDFPQGVVHSTSTPHLCYTDTITKAEIIGCESRNLWAYGVFRIGLGHIENT